MIEELNYWLRELSVASERTMVLFEQSNYASTGSLVSGRVGLDGCHWDTFEDGDIGDVEQKTRARCINWAMNEFKSQLQDQFSEQR